MSMGCGAPMPRASSGRLDFRTVADDEHGELVGVNVLFGGRGRRRRAYFLECRAVGFKIIGGIAVEFEFFALVEDLVSGVVAEEERVEDVVLGALELGLGEGPGVEAGDLGVGGLGGVHGGVALGEHVHAGRCRGGRRGDRSRRRRRRPEPSWVRTLWKSRLPNPPPRISFMTTIAGTSGLWRSMPMPTICTLD